MLPGNSMFERQREYFVVKSVVWVMAAMLALPPMAAPACDGTTNSKKKCCCTGLSPTSGKMAQRARCCSVRKPKTASLSCCARKKQAKRSCCSRYSTVRQTRTSSHGASLCRPLCSCNARPTPATPAVPPTKEGTSADQLAMIHAIASLPAGDVTDSSRGSAIRLIEGTTPTSSLQRCIELSRFLL